MATLINVRDKALQTARYRRGATLVSLSAPAGAFIKPKNGAAVTPASIKITAIKNEVFTNAAVYKWEYALSTTPNTYTIVTSGGVAVTTSELTVTNTDIVTAIGTTGASEVYYKCTVSEAKLDTASSIFKIIYSKESDDPITINMTKTNVSVQCDQYGTPSTFAGTGTTITVTRGSTVLGYSSSGVAAANTFTVTTAADANRTLGGTANSTSTSYVLDDLTALATDQSSTIFTITVYDGNAIATNTFSRTLSYTKVKNGLVGSDGRRYYLLLNTLVLAKSSSSAAISGTHTPSSIVATGKVIIGSGNPTNYGYVTITDNTGVESSPSQYTQTYNIANNYTATSYTVKLYDTATKTNLLDSQTVPVVYTGTSGTSGTSAINLVLSNDNVSVPTASDGSSAVYTGTGTDIVVYEGSTQLTYDAGATPAQSTWKIASVNATNITAGSYATKTLQLNATALTLAAGTATLTYAVQSSAPYVVGQIVSLAGFSPTQTSGTVNNINSSFTVLTCTTTQLTFALTGSYTVTTLGTVSGSVNTTQTTAAATSMTADTASITYNISGVTAAATTFTISKTQSFKKLKAGSVGVDGKRAIILNAYQWATAAPSVPTQAFVYTWASGNISVYPTGWTAAAAAAPGNGYTLYQLNLTVSDSATTATTNVNWSASTLNIIGYRQDGTIGELSAYTKTAYITLTTATPPSTPAATTGATSLPAAVGAVSWTSASPGTVPDGSYVYISTGIYGPTSNQVIWAAPYLSYFKVGSLSAISASLGAVGVSNTGNIHSGTGVSDSKTYGDSKAGFFLGYDGTAYKMDVGSSTSYLRFDGSTVSATGINIYTADNQDILTLAGGQEWTTTANGYITLYSALSLKKTGITNAYDSWAYGKQFYSSGAAVSFQAKEAVNRQFEVGLKESVTPGQNATIDYGILLSTSGTVSACVGGVVQFTMATSYALTDQFLVAYDNKYVYYYINGILKYTHTTGVVASKSFVPKISFYTAQAYATAVKFQPWSGVGIQGAQGDQGVPGADSTVPGPTGPQGNAGEAGPAGTRAAVTWISATSYSEWTTSGAEAAANSYFTTNFAGKVLGDRATIYNSTTGKGETRTWNGTSWVPVSAYIDGNLLVSGSITSDALAGNIVTVGQRIVSSDGLFVIDLANKTISISV
jgi:hypothetical protein